MGKKKKIVVVTASERAGSNSADMAEALARGAREAGHDVDVVSLRGKTVLPCRGCYECSAEGRCTRRDDAPAITAAMHEADVVVVATPTYFYGMAGQLKCLLDRTTPWFGKPGAFGDVCVLVSAGADDPSIGERVAEGVRGWAQCFEGCRVRSVLFGGGLDGEGAAASDTALMERARALGAAL